ncbi:MAG: DUF5654 family protein [Patescibacteria group bacterium]
MANLQTPERLSDLPKSIISQMILLSTGGFGVVVALAWNEFIKNVVEVYIKPYLGQGSGVWSLFIYATVVTVIAVLVTMQLSKIQGKLERSEERKRLRREEAEKRAKQSPITK